MEPQEDITTSCHIDMDDLDSYRNYLSNSNNFQFSGGCLENENKFCEM